MGVVAINVETEQFRQGNMAPKIICLSVANEYGGNYLLVGNQIESFLKVLLIQAIDKGVSIVGHVVAYDFACILANYPSLWDLVWRAYDADGVVCTAIREKLLDIEAGQFRQHIVEDTTEKHSYDLADIVFRWLNSKLEKGDDSWRTRFSELVNTPVSDWPAAAVNYAKEDAKQCLRLYADQTERSRRTNYPIPTQYEDARADFALRLISVYGIMTDRNKVEAMYQKGLARLDQLGQDLAAHGLVSYSANKTTDMFKSNAVQEPNAEIHRKNKVIQEEVEKRHPNPPRTEKGNIQIDAVTLAECNWESFDWLTEFSAVQKTISTYLTKMIDSPIHASFYSIGAVSGRTSCSSPNLQNQPRMPGVRECFVPRPGNVFLACDFSSQEMRTLAQSCLDILGVSRLAEFFKRDPGFDPHIEFAKQLAAGNPNADLKELRQRAKTCNFGYPGGMGAFAFVLYAKGYGLQITATEAKDLRDNWLKQWPEMPKYFNHVANTVGTEGFATVTHPRSGFRRANCKFTDACNSYFQTLANHASKRALWKVCMKCFCDSNSFLYGSRPVLYVHDEIVLETPEAAGHDAALEMSQTMIQAMEEWTPDIPSHTEAALMRCWSKKAKPVFKDGRLVPWEEPSKCSTP